MDAMIVNSMQHRNIDTAPKVRTARFWYTACSLANNLSAENMRCWFHKSWAPVRSRCCRQTGRLSAQLKERSKACRYGVRAKPGPEQSLAKIIPAKHC